MEEQSDLIARQDMTDEMRIQFAIDEFYEFMKSLDNYDPEKLIRALLMRNNLINMCDTYLKKFNNKLITDDFYSRLKTAKENARQNGGINKYHQYMNEVRVIQEFKGIEENIIDKLSEQLINQWVSWEEENAE